MSDPAAEPKAVRFEIEYDDGSVVSFLGEHAERQLKWLDGCCMVAHIHGMGTPPDPLPARTVSKK